MRATLPLIAAVALIAGCAQEKTTYGDARGVETVTNQFGSTDLQMIAESMARSMQQAPAIAAGNLPIVTVQEVKNKTSEYIDTRAITDSIRSELQKGGRVRFAVDAPGMTQQTDEIKRQQSEYYAKEQAVEKGQMIGAQHTSAIPLGAVGIARLVPGQGLSRYEAKIRHVGQHFRCRGGIREGQCPGQGRECGW